jgi:hypothetical protein
VTPGDFQSYLRAKRTVDDRALRRDQVDRLREWLATRAAPGGGPLRILEVGAGIGTMIERVLEWDVLPEADVRYTAVDLEPANVRTLRSALPAWASERGYSVETGDRLTISDGDRRLVVRPVAADASAVVAEATAEWDLLVGAALLDVIGLDALPTLLSALAPGGRWYFPITFDGGTRFTPTHPADRAVERYYHAHMDAKPGGDSRAGTHALDRLQDRADATVLAVGGADWVVRPVDGEYPADEAAFLDHILGTVETAVGEVDRGEDLPDDTLADWVATRADHLANRELTYTTHQLDLVGRVEG